MAPCPLRWRSQKTGRNLTQAQALPSGVEPHACVVGIAALGNWIVALAGGLILFREFSVSALRETLAPKGLKLPVTTLAKWKTTLQLVALAAELFVFGWRAWGLPEDPDLIGRAFLTAHGVLALATVVTVWTGVEYALAARRALRA